MTDSRTRVMAQETKQRTSIHLILSKLVAELMEAVLVELVRLATELEAVKGQVENRVQCAARSLCTSHYGTAISGSGSQHDRRLNHREAGRHLPQQFGGSRLDYGDFAFRMEGYAASPIT